MFLEPLEDALWLAGERQCSPVHKLGVCKAHFCCTVIYPF
jgi:hypothetical protein